jgi:hypothetical protein
LQRLVHILYCCCSHRHCLVLLFCCFVVCTHCIFTCNPRSFRWSIPLPLKGGGVQCYFSLLLLVDLAVPQTAACSFHHSMLCVL